MSPEEQTRRMVAGAFGKLATIHHTGPVAPSVVEQLRRQGELTARFLGRRRPPGPNRQQRRAKAAEGKRKGKPGRRNRR